MTYLCRDTQLTHTQSGCLSLFLSLPLSLCFHVTASLLQLRWRTPHLCMGVCVWMGGWLPPPPPIPLPQPLSVFLCSLSSSLPLPTFLPPLTLPSPSVFSVSIPLFPSLSLSLSVCLSVCLSLSLSLSVSVSVSLSVCLSLSLSVCLSLSLSVCLCLSVSLSLSLSLSNTFTPVT